MGLILVTQDLISGCAHAACRAHIIFTQSDSVSYKLDPAVTKAISDCQIDIQKSVSGEQGKGRAIQLLRAVKK